MAVTIFGTNVTWNDGTATYTASGTGKVTNIDTQTGVTISSFVVGTYQLVRTAGFLTNSSYGGQFVGAYYINSNTVSVQQNGFDRGAYSSSPCVVTSTTVSQDYNSNWWYATGVSADSSSITIPTVSTTATVTLLAGTWKSRGQCVGRGVVTPRYGNFVLMQRVA